MRVSTLILSGATVGALFLSTFPASAAVLSVAQVTNGCPDVDQARDCPVLAEEFLSTRPMSRDADGQIVSLVLAIAELSQVPRVSLPVCLNAADGLRVLAGGVSSADQQTQINDIADALCDGTSTAAIRRGLGDVNSLASTSEGGAGGSVAGGGGVGPGGEGGGVDNGGDGGGVGDGGGAGDGGGNGHGDDGNNGHGNDDDHDDDSNPAGGGQGVNDDDNGAGLGSNDASAGHASANGESHANEHAVNNTRGNNGN